MHKAKHGCFCVMEFYAMQWTDIARMNEYIMVALHWIHSHHLILMFTSTKMLLTRNLNMTTVRTVVYKESI